MTGSKAVLRLARVAPRPTSSSVLPRALLQPAVLARPFHESGCQLDENKKPPTPSKEEDPVNFRLSLYQSTFDRIQRERADNERFSKIRKANDRDWIGNAVGWSACT